ncbi:hypothetical protein [Streptomyces sp. NPDC057253]|uniref:hypothetical protein n=1 Tax=Streptomyces sp. NPDC057253 TaxID=3346069 RepID=UPI003629BEAE
MFEQRTEAEMRLYSEKTAKELALKKRRQEESDDGMRKNDDVVDPPSRTDGAHVTTETKIPANPERAD